MQKLKLEQLLTHQQIECRQFAQFLINTNFKFIYCYQTGGQEASYLKFESQYHIFMLEFHETTFGPLFISLDTSRKDLVLSTPPYLNPEKMTNRNTFFNVQELIDLLKRAPGLIEN